MDSDIDLKGVLGLIRRQFLLIVSAIAMIFALTLVLTYLITPKYTASSLVLVDTSLKNLLDATSASSNQNTDNSRVESEVGILRSDRILLNVVRDNDLAGDREFGLRLSLKERILTLLHIPLSAPLTGDKAVSRALAVFRSAVAINRNGLTYLITVAVTSRDGAKAAKLANALSDTYIREQVDAKISATLANRDTIQSRVATANAAIVENERKFDTYITDNIGRLEQQTNATGLTALRTELQTITAASDAGANRMAALQKALQSRDFSSLTARSGSDALSMLQRQRDALTKGISSSLTAASDNAGLRTRLSEIDRSMAEAASLEVGTLQQSVSGYQDQADDVRQKIRSAVLQSNLSPEVLAELYSLQQQAEIARSQYQTLLSRLQDLDAQASLQLADSRVVSAALVPSEPSFPNRRLILGLSLLLSVAAGFGVAILREYFIGGFISENQIEAVLKVPLSAIAPRQAYGDEHAKPASPSASLADLMVTAPLSLFSESVRRLRLTLDRQERNERNPAQGDGYDGTIIVVSSALPTEGKSTIALSLARAYALTGKRTLLIDCDLRKPSIHKQLNVKPNHHFIDYLRQDRSTATLASLIMQDPLSPLTVLLGDRRSDIATDELVMSDKMGRILANARKHFDYVVIDTPPVEPVVDGLYLSRHADMIVFVIKWASTPQSSAKHAVTALKENKNPHAGIVTLLNQQDRGGLSGSYADAR